jgi:hypothetical protein
VSERSVRMLQAFAEFEHRARIALERHAIVGVPTGTRLMQIIRHENGWQLWVSTADFKYGTYFMLYEDGRVTSTTIRRDEGDDTITVRPSDEFIRSKAT